jgi:aspartyl-tRNA(Asn)/glutamyl-tRNA(Gln) amidotransferase subunit B
MEEDTGKLSHQEVHGEKASLIDFNRSGLPLVEIVTEPDFHDAKDVKEYLQKLQQIVRYLDVSEADMEKGEMRLEPNISLLSLRGGTTKQSPNGKHELPNYKVEVKNINSFRFVEKAIAYELDRQSKLLDQGERPAQETRGWDENRQRTFSQRSKEDAQDYRYFPEPDIPPIRMSKNEISNLEQQVPELPAKKIERFQKEFSLTYYDAEILTREKFVADYFEEAVNVLKQEARNKKQEEISVKDISNWIVNRKVDLAKTLPAELIQQIMASKQTATVDEDELHQVIAAVLKENEKAVEDYKKGKEASLMFLLGQTMKKLGKKVDANLVKASIKSALK